VGICKQSVLWLADLDVNAFLGDLAGDPWNVNLSDRPGPLVIQISQDAQSHERNRQKETEQSIIVHDTVFISLSWLLTPDTQERSPNRYSMAKIGKGSSHLPWLDSEYCQAAEARRHSP
jgi:hypothetical protein